MRDLAGSLGLRTATKPDSQDVCFIPRGGRQSFLDGRLELTPAAVREATTGAERGTVPAAELVTVGQRRGVARGEDGEARYVVDVDVPGRAVLVASLEAAMVECVDLLDGSVLLDRGAADGADVLVQTSAHGASTPAVLECGATTSLRLARPVRPVAPGQLAVLYDVADDRVVGSGTVARRSSR